MRSLASLSFLICQMTLSFCILPLGDHTYSYYSNYCSYANVFQIHMAEPDPSPEFLNPEFKLPQTPLLGICRPLELSMTNLLTFLSKPVSLPGITDIHPKRNLDVCPSLPYASHIPSVTSPAESS